MRTSGQTPVVITKLSLNSPQKFMEIAILLLFLGEQIFVCIFKKVKHFSFRRRFIEKTYIVFF